jgi:hypothetical protein
MLTDIGLTLRSFSTVQMPPLRSWRQQLFLRQSSFSSAFGYRSCAQFAYAVVERDPGALLADKHLTGRKPYTAGYGGRGTIRQSP